MSQVVEVFELSYGKWYNSAQKRQTVAERVANDNVEDLSATVDFYRLC